MLNVNKILPNALSAQFCDDYLTADVDKRLILGRNNYAKDIADMIEIGAFIDDYTDETEFLGKPVIRSNDVPSDALVLSTLLGKPLTGEKKLQELGVKHLDYFSFYEHTSLDLPVVRFWGGFKQEFKLHEKKYIWIESLLSDDESKRTYENIISFRLSGNLDYMKTFSDREKYQYFEDFLCLSKEGETFVDVGGYDGFTSEEFIRLCPGFRAVYFFEPDANNFQTARNRLAKHDNIHLMQIGASDKKDTLQFSSSGSVSAITVDGDIEINVDAIDSVIDDDVTFIKMDIEGAENNAIDGARQTITKYHPRLAICVYHKDTDFWKIPEQVFSIRDDYDIYLRHYTEGVAETVMFFIPQ